MRKERVVLYMLCSAGMLATLSQLVFLPSVTAIREELASTTFQVSLAIALYSLALAVAQLFYGPMTDRWKPKTILLVGLTVFGLSSFGIFLAANIGTVILFRVTQALGAAAVGVCGNAVISEMFDGVERDRAITVFQMFHSLGAALGPAVGATVEAVGNWRWSFMILALLIGTIILVLARKLPDARVVNTFSFRAAYRLLRAPNLVLLSLSAAATSFVIQSYHTSLSFLFTDYFRIEADWTGYLFMAIPLGVASGSRVSSMLLRIWHRDRIVLLGLVALIVTSGIFVGLISLFKSAAIIYALVPNLYLIGVSLGIAFSVVTSILISWFRDLRGTALSMLLFSRHIAGTVGPIATSYLIGQGSVPSAYLLIFLIGLSALPLFIYSVRANRIVEEAGAVRVEAATGGREGYNNNQIA
mgnify:CR=1 FL=1|jgi:Arabinose efflux permease